MQIYTFFMKLQRIILKKPAFAMRIIRDAYVILR